ncbi:MAG: purine-binding chemotaxis protein CheW [Nitrospinae bacterium]|nr:purine-binding chemotaxis protein CheW [Nitrospinota bacterium]
MDNPIHLVIFILDNHRFALPLSSVERVIRLVEITPLPKAPEIVIGIVNMQGRVIPVVNIRKRFRLPEREIELTDHVIILQAKKNTLGAVVDTVSGVFEYPEHKIINTENIFPGIEYIDGVVKLEDGLILIHNIDRFLSLKEERMLNGAIKKI